MEAIREIVTPIVKNDVTISGYLGSSDRVFAWQPNKRILYDDSLKSAIIYKLSSSRRGFRWSYPNQIPNHSVFFKVISISQSVANLIGDRLEVLLDQKSASSNDYYIKFIESISRSDGGSEGTATQPLYVVNLSFNLTNIFKR